MRNVKYIDKDINKVIGKMTYIADYLDDLWHSDYADTIEEAREMLKYLLKIKTEVKNICNDKS